MTIIQACQLLVILVTTVGFLWWSIEEAKLYWSKKETQEDTEGRYGPGEDHPKQHTPLAKEDWPYSLAGHGGASLPREETLRSWT